VKAKNYYTINSNLFRFRIDPNGKEYFSKCLKEFCREHVLKYSMMSQVSRDEIEEWKGWKCIRLSKMK